MPVPLFPSGQRDGGGGVPPDTPAPGAVSGIVRLSRCIRVGRALLRSQVMGSSGQPLGQGFHLAASPLPTRKKLARVPASVPRTAIPVIMMTTAAQRPVVVLGTMSP